MNKINKFKKILAVVAVFCLLAVSSQVKTYPHIPLKGLFEVLKVDDIGFSHALLHSKWIENMYQYGAGKPHRKVPIKKGRDTSWRVQEKNDAVANLIRKFWFRKSENHQLLPTKFGFLANIPNEQLGTMFGKLINYVYLGCNPGDEPKLIDELLKYAPRDSVIDQEIEILIQELGQKKAQLNDERFSGLQEANSTFRQKCRSLEQKFNMQQFRQELKQLKKIYKEDKKLCKIEEKKMRERYNTNEFSKAVQQAEEKSFAKLSQAVRNARDEYKKIVRAVQVCEGKINGKIIKRRQAVKKTLLTPIEKSLQFCKAGNVYMPRATESILWALFFHKLDSFISLKAKIKAINDCIGQIGREFKREAFCEKEVLEDLYRQEDFLTFEHMFQMLSVDAEIGMLDKDYGLGLHYLIRLAVGMLPPVVTQGRFGYEYEPGKISYTRPNCHETALLDLFSILWYNPKKGIYDNSLFAQNIIENGTGFKELREALKYFYLADMKGIKPGEYTCECEAIKPDGVCETVRFTSLAKLKTLTEKTPEGGEKLKITPEEVGNLSISEVPVDYVTRPEVQQEFMNIVSNIPGIVYRSVVPDKGPIFEIKSDVNNICKLFNYFYGTSVQKTSQLGDQNIGISNARRNISFMRLKVKKGPRKIKIGVNGHNLFVNIHPRHTSLLVPARDEKVSCFLKQGLGEKFLKQLLNPDAANLRSVSIFTLLTSRELLASKEVFWSLPALNLVYYSLNMKTSEEKLEIIKDILNRDSKSYEHCKEMIHNLIEKLPRDYKYRVSKIIMTSKFAKEEFFQKFITHTVVSDSRFCEKHERVVYFLKCAVKKGLKDIALAIVSDPLFDINGKGVISILKKAIVRGNSDIVLAIISLPQFYVYVNSKVVTSLLLQALAHENNNIALAIMNNPAFNFCGSVFKEVFKKRYVQAFVNLIKHLPDICLLENGVCLVLKKGFKKVDLKKIKKFSCYDCEVLRKTGRLSLVYVSKDFEDLGDLLGYMVKQGNKEAALKIVKSSQFNANFKGAGDVLKQAFQKNFIDVSLEIAKHPTFDAHSKAVKNFIDPFYYRFQRHLNPEFKSYREVMFAIMNHPTFVWWGGILESALRFDQKKAALKIVKHPRFDASQPELGSALALALRHDIGCKKVADVIIKNPHFNGWGFALKAALESLWICGLRRQKPLIEKIMDHSQFDMSSNGIDEVLVFVLKRIQGLKGYGKKDFGNDMVQSFIQRNAHRWKAENKFYKKIADTIMNDPQFQGLESAFLIALKKKKQEIALKIVKHKRFKACFNNEEDEEAILKLLLRRDFKKVALAMVTNETFDVDLENTATILRLALKRNYKKIALAIVNNKEFEANFKGVVSVLKLAIRNGFKDVALAIVKNKEFRASFAGVEGALKLALEKKYKDVALSIVNNERFDADCDDVGDILKLALERGYKKVALAIVQSPVFEAYFYGIVDLLMLALKKGYQEVALAIVKNDKFKASFKGMGDAFGLALKKGCQNVALAIVENETFDADRIWVQKALTYAKTLAKRYAKRRQELQEIIDVIERKRK